MMALRNRRERLAGEVGVLWAMLTQLAGFVVDIAVGARHIEDAKDLEIALLRHQLRLLMRRASRPPRLSHWEKLTLAVLAAKLGRMVTDSRGRLSRDGSALAPRVGAPEMDVSSARRRRTAAATRRGGGAAPAPRRGQPALWLQSAPG
jgi:hypothetical protein